MSLHEIRFTYTRHDNADQLNPADQQLIQEALNTCSRAYAPYSDFKVGVAIRTQEGVVVTGSNQENSAYPIGQCAERVALYRMSHEIGRAPIDTIAIAVENPNQLMPATPCGSCRQVLTEYRSYQREPIRLLLKSKAGDDIMEIADITDLLPLAFDGKFLGQ
jgi:cytidine deaminase